MSDLDLRRIYAPEIQELKTLRRDHEVIENETIDALRAIFQHAAGDTGEAVMHLMQGWHCRHQPIEWALIVAYAKLPKELADAVDQEDF